MSSTPARAIETGPKSNQTRNALIASARARFAEHGYAATSVTKVASDASVTKGALYHHFATKEGLFTAVLEDVEAELQIRSRQAAHGVRSPLGRLESGFEAYLDAVLDPEIGRIALIDGPAVVGAAEYQRIVRRFAHDDVVFVLGVGRPDITAEHLDVLASMLLGGLTSAAQVIVSSDTPKDARTEAGAAVQLLLEGLIPESD